MNADEDVAGSLNFSWLVEGEIAGCAGPAFHEELDYLKAQGIEALVRLAHPDDPDGVGVTSQEVEQAGLDDCPEPVRDWTAPRQNQIQPVLRFVFKALSEGKPVAVSCGAGCGRTGTILACYLVAQGRSADEAIEHLIDVRPRSKEILRVPGQKDAVVEFERRLKRGQVDLC